MNNGKQPDENLDRKHLADLTEQFRRLPMVGATTADRASRDLLLDELQDAVGLAGKMVTEQDILRRANRMVAER